MSPRIASLASLAPVLLALLAGCSSAVAEPPPASGEKPGEPSTKTEPEASTSIDLGNKPAGTELSFDVPANALGFAIVAQAATGPGASIGVAELRDPSGAVIVADFASIRHSVGAGVDTFVFPPIADAARTVRAGRWKVKLGGESYDPKSPKGSAGRPWNGDVRGVVHVQTSANGTFQGGQLDLDIYVPPWLKIGEGATLDVTSAPNDAALRDRIDRVYALQQRLYGIQCGEVRFHPIAASVASIAGYEALDAANMLATEHGARPSGQLILTNVLEPDGAGEGEISGIANCLPGAVGVPRTKCFAVIVALRSSAEDDANTIVHELGHFIGLEHTSELDGGYYDELSDTPKCENRAKGALSSCPDFSNLMFPTSIARETRTVVVSATQARVMQASPMYRAAAQASSRR